MKIKTRKRRRVKKFGASSLDPHPNPPPRHGGGSFRSDYPKMLGNSDATKMLEGVGRGDSKILVRESDADPQDTEVEVSEAAARAAPSRIER
jgi:hypothetical protein